MITSVYETVAEPKTDFWTYLICRVVSGRRNRFNVIRIDSCCEKMETLGRELTLGHCRNIIKEKRGAI